MAHAYFYGIAFASGHRIILSHYRTMWFWCKAAGFKCQCSRCYGHFNFSYRTRAAKWVYQYFAINLPRAVRDLAGYFML